MPRRDKISRFPMLIVRRMTAHSFPTPVADEELNPNPHVWMYCIDGHALLYSISLFSLLVRRGRGGGTWNGEARGLKKEAHRKMDRFWLF
jgi:hypothetical protein